MKRLISVLILLSLFSCTQTPRHGTVTILHTNDMHAQFVPLPATWIDAEPKPLIGGMTALLDMINKTRIVYPNSLLLDAGDICTGTLLSKIKVDGALNGGFVQMSLELSPASYVDASAFTGIELQIAGNNEYYNLHLRTTDLERPWQSYRAEFFAEPDWQTIRIPFSRLQPYRTDRPFRPDRLLRLGLVAIGRDFQAELCMARVKFY